MKATVLVVTTVHRPDDTRIRERLIRTLAKNFEVKYASKSPGPTDASDLEWIDLKGGRLRRNMQALWLALFARWDILVIHDPENLIAGFLARIVRRRPVVFDVHENIPAMAMTRSWVPRPFRRSLALLLRGLLGVAERVLTVTLAEPGYQRLFDRDHVAFPNFPDTTRYPAPVSSNSDEVVYLGDVTFERGAAVAMKACESLEVPLLFVGRVPSEVQTALLVGASKIKSVEFSGQMPNPEALKRIGSAAVAISPLLDGPNYRHSQPTKILEYLALGLPVVASDLPGTRQLVKNLAAVFLVAPGNSDELAAGIAEASDPKVRALAVEQAPSIRGRFKWPDEVVTEFYNLLV